MKTRSLSIFSILTLTFFFAVSTVIAHPPSEIIITNDKTTASFKIIHHVKNPSNHYIDDIELFLNGKFIAEIEPKSQENENEQNFSYDIPGLKAGDEIKIKAECNRSGSMTETYTAK